MSVRSTFEFILLSLLWGVSFLMMRVAVPEFGPVAMVSVRLGLAALCLLPILVVKNLFGDLKRHYQPIMVVGLFNSLIPFCLLGYASLTFTAGYTSIINATTSLWAAVVGIVVLRVRLSGLAYLGLGLGFLGVVAMVWRDLGGLESAQNLVAKDNFVLALIAGLGATLSYGSITLYMKHKMAHVNSLAATCGSLLMGAMVMAPFGIWLWPDVMPSLEAWLAVSVMAIFSTAWGIVLFFRLLREIGPNRAITVTYLIPLVGMGCGAIFLDEQVTDSMIIGCVMILLGVGLATGLIGKKVGKKAEHSSSQESK